MILAIAYSFAVVPTFAVFALEVAHAFAVVLPDSCTFRRREVMTDALMFAGFFHTLVELFTVSAVVAGLGGTFAVVGLFVDVHSTLAPVLTGLFALTLVLDAAVRTQPPFLTLALVVVARRRHTLAPLAWVRDAHISKV